MTIKVGDRVPETTFTIMTADGPGARASSNVFSGKKVVLFAIPGAYTPTCHMKHLPGFVEKAQTLTNKGVDEICCTAVNDIFVLDSWAKDVGTAGKITMLADGSAHFARAVGLDVDLTDHGMGVRSSRYAMLVDDGVVTVLNIEDAPPQHDKSSAVTMLDSL